MKLQVVFVLALAAGVAAGCSKKENSTPTQPTTCAYSLASTAQSPGAAGGTFSVAITRTSGSCTWAASSNASWVTFSGPTSGSDTGTITLVVAPNADTAARAGTVTVSWNGGTAQIAVNQAGLAFGQCVYAFPTPAQTVPAAGGASTAALSVTGNGCSWTATSDASWLTITSGGSGTASTSIAFMTTANPDVSARVGTITVSYPGGSVKETVTQNGVSNCVYTMSPAAQTVPAAGGSFTVTPIRNTPNGCSWAASTDTPWISLPGPTTGLSGVPLPYNVQANGTGSTRTGRITVIWSGGNLDFVVTQTP
jgi:BACON domain-containing protein/all-beta uncharacterized protein